VSKLHRQKESLHGKVEALKVLEDEILSNVEEDIKTKSAKKIDHVLVTSRPPGKSMDAPKNKRPVNTSVYPEVVPGNVEPSNDSLDSPNSFTISRTGTLMISGTLSLEFPSRLLHQLKSTNFGITGRPCSYPP